MPDRLVRVGEEVELMETTGGERTASPISLDGPSVRLRPVTREDYAFLWECRCHPDGMHLWMGGRTLPTLEQYSRELDGMLSSKILTLLVIETRTNHHPIGFVIAHDYNPYDRTLFCSQALHPAYVKFGWGWEAGVMFWEYLFTYFDLRKLNMEIFAFNRHSLRLVLRMGAREEGRFREEHYYQGAYHDVIRLALTRAAWERSRERVVAYFARRRAHGVRANGAAGEGHPAVGAAAVGADGYLASAPTVGHNGHGPAHR